MTIAAQYETQALAASACATRARARGVLRTSMFILTKSAERGESRVAVQALQ
jgi:hypothetical protein